MRHPAAVVAIAALAVALVVVVGRWERSRSIAERRHGVEQVLALTGGGLDRGRVSAYRYRGDLNCLLYRWRSAPSRLELCFDPEGRVVDTIDRRTSTLRTWSFIADPADAPRLSTAALMHEFRSVGAFRGHAFDGRLPFGGYDAGPTVVLRKHRR